MGRSGILLVALLVASRIAEAQSVGGSWGAFGAQMTLNDAGGRVEFGCGVGMLDSPLIPDANGRFTVAGRYEDWNVGPDRADAAPVPRAAAYSGRIDGNQMSLAIRVEGDRVPRTYTLTRGRKVKLIRCR
jgi:hypothetical protein